MTLRGGSSTVLAGGRQTTDVINNTHIERDLRTFLDQNFPLAYPRSLDRNESLFEAGLIDSTGVLELVDFIEDRYDIQIRDDELLPDNLDSIDCLVAFITRKQRE